MTKLGYECKIIQNIYIHIYNIFTSEDMTKMSQVQRILKTLQRLHCVPFHKLFVCSTVALFIN